MGTNYYLTPKPAPCPTCGHDETGELHIGKSSLGWVFMWHGYRNLSESDTGPMLTTPTEWFAYLAEAVASGSVIRDEYGDEHSLDVFAGRVLAKRKPGPRGDPLSNDSEGGWEVTHPEGDDMVFQEFC